MASNFHPYAVAFSTVFLFLFHRAMGSHHIYAEYQSLDPTDTTTVKHAYRTGFHFQPPRHWINDPNGPMYYKGLYHLFYQYNPKGAVWGNIVWAHSVSKDLVNWIALNHAIQPSKPFDAKGCWSGSATIVPGKGPVIIYTGIDTQGRQVQNYAVPENVSDPFLVKWVKPDDNPIAVPPPGINISSFRDPTTAWFGPDGHWRMVIGSRKDLRGLALLYKSRDFKKWTQGVQPLHSAPGTGMWECPDFFPVSLEGVRGLDTNAAGIGTKHVLKASFDLTRFDYYTVGEYHPGKDVYVPDNTSADGWSGLRYDYGNFYASKSFYDPVKRRRVLWGWVNESDTSHNDVKKGWSGIQAIPRTIWLDPNHRQLRTWPVVEVQKLRGKGVKMAGLILPKQRVIKVKGITAAQADVEVIFQLGGLEKAEEYDPKWVNAEDLCAIKGAEVEGGVGPFGLFTLATPTLEERTPVFFRVFKRKDVEKKFVVLICSDARSSSLNKELYRPSFGGFVDADLSSKKKLSLRTLVDQSVVESFAEGGKTAITSRVYPVGREAHLHVFNNGREVVKVESLKAWSMRKPLFMNQKIP